MAEHILFITGKLAEKSLHRVLESMQPTKFTYTVHQIGVSVAALITTEMIIRRLNQKSCLNSVSFTIYFRTRLGTPWTPSQPNKNHQCILKPLKTGLQIWLIKVFFWQKTETLGNMAPNSKVPRIMKIWFPPRHDLITPPLGSCEVSTK